MGSRHKPSIKKISEITGFSTATVSNALNMKRGVNRKTAETIFQAAKDLGYSLGSKGLKTIKFVTYGRTGDIVFGSPFHPAVIEGVESQAKLHGFTTQFIRLDRQADDFDEQIAQLTMDLSSGIILLAAEMEADDYEPFTTMECPIVLIDGWDEKMRFTGVLINNADPVSEAADYLIAAGHTDIGYIAGMPRIYSFRTREMGYLRALNAHGLPVNPAYRVEVNSKLDGAYEDMLAWLAKKPSLPTAFFADNDAIALGALKAMTERGIAVPGDVSIIGFDDLDYSAISNPPLTTISVNRQAMGAEAVELLLNIVESPHATTFKVECGTTFVERESVRAINPQAG